MRGPQVMRLLEPPEETDKVMTADGFLRTGDIARSTSGIYPDRRSQEGHHHRLGLQRLSQRDRGHRRDAFRACWKSARSACRTPRLGEAVMIVVVRRDPDCRSRNCAPFAGNTDRLQDAEALLSSNELPKTNVGKILRRALRDEVAKKI